MDIHQDEIVVDHRASLERGMREYLAEASPPYRESDVAACGDLLDEHLAALARLTNRDDALSLVRKTVLALNSLNSRCDGQLIETDQREQICALLIRAGYLRGFNAEDEDISEAWRAW